MDHGEGTADGARDARRSCKNRTMADAAITVAELPVFGQQRMVSIVEVCDLALLNETKACQRFVLCIQSRLSGQHSQQNNSRKVELEIDSEPAASIENGTNVKTHRPWTYAVPTIRRSWAMSSSRVDICLYQVDSKSSHYF